MNWSSFLLKPSTYVAIIMVIDFTTVFYFYLSNLYGFPSNPNWLVCVCTIKPKIKILLYCKIHLPQTTLYRNTSVMSDIHSYEKPGNFSMSESLIVFNQFINLPDMTLVCCCHQPPLCMWLHSSSWFTTFTLFGTNNLEYSQKFNLLLKAQERVLTAGFYFQTIATQASCFPSNEVTEPC